MTPRPLIVAALIALVAAACSVGSAADLDGEWILLRGSVGGQALQLVEGARVSLRIDGSEVGGTAACNQYGGEIDRDGDRISIGALSMTEMGCAEPIMALEAAYLDGLSRVDTARRDADQLRLTGPATELDFTLLQPTPDADPVGTRWRLESLITGDSVSSVFGEATLILAEDGTVSGSTGCRSFRGSYTLEGDELAIADLVVDLRACDDQSAGQDSQVLGLLEGPLRVTVSGDRLTLMDGANGLDYRAIG
ncbi:MAG: META domain-containing protein [Candidatus Limnocylindria bacterium]